MKATPTEDLSAYLDGELTDAEAAEIEAELARDPVLRAELAELQQVVDWVRQDGLQPAPFGFHRRVMDQVDREDAPSTDPWAWLRRPLGLPLRGWAVALAAAAVLWWVLPRQRPVAESEGPGEQNRPAVAMPPPGVSAPPKVQSLRDPIRDPLEQPQKGVDAGEPPPTKSPSRPQEQGPSVPQKALGEASAPPDAPHTAPHTASAPAFEGAGSETPTDAGGTPNAAASRDEAPAASPTGYGMELRSADPKMKRRVLAVASRFGRPVGPDGQEPTSATLESRRETLLVEIPQARLTAFEAALRELGYGLEGAGDRGLLQGSRVVVRLQLVDDAPDAGVGRDGAD